MEWYTALTLLLGGTVCLLLLGLPVAFAFFSANILGAYLFMRGSVGLSLQPIEYALSVTKFSLVPVALFILMGEILFQTGVAQNSIKAIDKLITRVPGRLAMVSIAGGTVFSSLSGSTLANTALLGQLMLPDMLKRGYHPTLAMGPIMAVGGIAMLIPPSALAVLLASLAERSISNLLLAGIVPGIIMAALFVVYVWLRVLLRPDDAPPSESPTLSGWARWQPFFIDVLPLFTIFVVVVGSIFFRIAAPEEAAALGCIAAVLVSAIYKKLNWSNLHRALKETAKITIMLLFIIAGSLTFAQILQISGATSGVMQALSEFDYTLVQAMIVMVLILLFLGCFMDQISMMLLTLPFFLPISDSLGADPIWLLVLMLIAMEVSLLTPPFGLLLFVMKGVCPPHLTIIQIYRAALPFIGLEMAVAGLVIAVPSVALWLPQMLSK